MQVNSICELRYLLIITSVITLLRSVNLIGQERSSDRIDLYFMFQ